MKAHSSNDNWYKSFFSGAALDLWRQAKTEDETEQESAFLLETFDLAEGAHLLDVPCGNGRLALPMVQAGYKVTALDYSQEFLDEGKKMVESADLDGSLLQFVQGDMRKISLKNKFDGAYCLGNSFGYFDRSGTEMMFQSLGECLKNGGKFVLESQMVAETFLVNGAEKEWIRVGDMLMLIENRYDPRESCVHTEYTFVRNGKEENRQATHWIYTAGEICAMLLKANFAVTDLFGSVECDSYELGSERLLLIAEKQR